MKKSLSLLLAIVMVITSITVIPKKAAAAGNEWAGYGILWSYDESSYTLTIEKKEGATEAIIGSGDLNASQYPWYSEIDSHSATLKEVLKHIKIGEGITVIGRNAFLNCPNLYDVKFPDSLEEIYERAFAQCPNLGLSSSNPSKHVGIHFGKKLKWIDDYAFLDTAMTEIYIPYDFPTGDGYIGDNAFGFEPDGTNKYKIKGKFTVYGISRVDKELNRKSRAEEYVDDCKEKYKDQYDDDHYIDFKDVTKGQIGSDAGYVLDIEKGLLTISGTGITYTYPDTYDSRYTHLYNFWDVDMCRLVKKAVVEEGITGLGNGLFWGFTELTEVVLPESLGAIGVDAFRGCTSLSKVTLPSKLLYIRQNAFDSCTSLKEIIIPDSVKEIDNAFRNHADGFVIKGNVNNEAVQKYFTDYAADAAGIKWEKTHHWDAGTVTAPATCGKDGTMTYKCTDTGCTETKTEVIPATGKHDFGTNEAKCKVCGAANPNYKAPAADTTKTDAKTKSDNTMTAKAKSVKIKLSSLAKKNQTVAAKKAITVKKAVGKVTYKKKGGEKKITVNKKGKFTVKKGLKAGTYKVKVQVKAAGNDEYNSKTVKVTVKFVVK